MFGWMYTKEVKVIEIIGQTPTGKPIELSTVVIKCRIEPSIRRIIDESGNEVVAGGYIMFPPATRFKIGSIVEWENIKRKLIKLEPIYSALEGLETHVEGWFK